MLVKAYEGGCRFDSWSEHFKPDVWKDAFAACGLTAEGYAERAYTPGDVLAWNFVDMLVTETYLAREYAKAFEGRTTDDCRNGCNGCFGEKHADDCRLS